MNRIQNVANRIIDSKSKNVSKREQNKHLKLSYNFPKYRAYTMTFKEFKNLVMNIVNA